MAVKFNILEGGFVQDSSAKRVIEFKVQGPLENPQLGVITSPAYTTLGFSISSAMLAITEGQIGVFKLELRSFDLNGTNSVTHISNTITVTTNGPQGGALSLSNATIGANKIVRLYVQYISGNISSDISLTLE